MTPRDDAGTTAGRLTRHYLVLHGLRWLATGLLIPVIVLLFTSRGFSLTEYGVIGTILGVTTFVLEVPTGGLADTMGRRRVLLLAGAFSIVSGGAFLWVAMSTQRPAWWIVVLGAVTMGVYRALESGPLDSWYVDGLQDLDPDADIERGLGHAGTVTGFGIAAGSLLSGGLLAWDPVAGIEPMAIVVGVSLALTIAQLGAIVLLMHDPRTATGDAGTLLASVRAVPHVIGSTLRLVTAGSVLALLLAIEATWSVGMVSFENLFPVQLQSFVGTADGAAALLGPVSAVAWAASGIGSNVATRAARRLGPWPVHAGLRLVQGAMIVAMALVGGTTGLVAAFVATYFCHGASGPVHMSLLHRQVTGDNRTTAVSLNSMTAFATFSVAGIGIGAVADTWSVATGIVVCGAVTALGALLAVAAGRRDPTRGRPPGAGAGESHAATIEDPADDDGAMQPTH